MAAAVLRLSPSVLLTLMIRTTCPRYDSPPLSHFASALKTLSQIRSELTAISHMRAVENKGRSCARRCTQVCNRGRTCRNQALSPFKVTSPSTNLPISTRSSGGNLVRRCDCCELSVCRWRASFVFKRATISGISSGSHCSSSCSKVCMTCVSGAIAPMVESNFLSVMLREVSETSPLTGRAA